MTIKARLDALERSMKAATESLSRQGRLPVRFIAVNDPEEGLEEFVLPIPTIARV
jgi:hypothetical protein